MNSGLLRQGVAGDPKMNADAIPINPPKITTQDKMSYAKEFQAFVKNVREKPEDYIHETEDIQENGTHFIVYEPRRKGLPTVHFVPKAVYDEFEGKRVRTLQEFTGPTVKIDTGDGRELQVSCYGIEQSMLAINF